MGAGLRRPGGSQRPEVDDLLDGLDPEFDPEACDVEWINKDTRTRLAPKRKRWPALPAIASPSAAGTTAPTAPTPTTPIPTN
jgi:hypothetical protein